MARFGVALTIFLGLATLAAGAEAQGYPPPPRAYQPVGVEMHDGFYLRMGLGVGYMESSASQAGQTLKLSGTAVGLDFAFGGVVAENLIVFGELAFLQVDSPTVSLGGVSGTANGSVDHIGIGPGIAYYFMPTNIYLSGALLLGRLQTHNNNSNQVGQTNFGVGGSLMAGKEWWVSPQWGLGVAVQLILANNHDPGIDADFTTIGGDVAFSATFN